jgi:diguanylate cyclase (GGDEF)-like protein/putative nucleotidyltransferase with HDIG domain
MRTFSDLQPAAKSYISTIVIVGLAAVLHSLAVLYRNPIGPEWLVLAALTLLTGSFTIKVPSMTARLTVSETFVFASVLLFGVESGTLTVVLETLVVALWIKREKRSIYRAVFNVAASALSIWVAATAFFSLSGTGPLLGHQTQLGVIFGPLVALTIIFFLLNSWLVAIAVGLEKNQSPVEIWWNNFTWVSINYFSGASVAAVIVTYASPLNERALFGTFVITVPLLLVCYLTFRTAMARVEDSNQHLSELNRLYLSTVETLAMAIDAKDQVTHGHIRRVQLHATNLAREVGVRDEKLLKAIEAAALLHDMGKLAVPEYILNKPGKLTEAEFEKMKLHASVGADILSAIDFPYPVVPIVRHHHENWDGTGYPSGIKGTDIPIGARILAVVDCFDALTSDRPYRPKLSDEEALAILLDRRGSMYDPLIVDTFMSVHATAPRDLARNWPPSDVLNTIAHSRRAPRPDQPSPTLDEITASADEMLSVYELARALAGHVSIADAGDVIAKHLRRLIPSSLCVFYIYDQQSDELEAQHVVGEGTAGIRGMRVGLGQRLSGWVAANRQTISNSDATLDLGDAARSASLRVRSCISTPLLSNDQLIGVLSLYSTEVSGFNDDHRRIIEVVARQIAHTFQRAIEFDNSSRRDALTGLPHLEQLEKLIQSLAEDENAECRHALLFIDVTDLERINVDHGRAAGDEVLRHVVRHARAGLRMADILFRNTGDDFVAFLGAADNETAELVANRIRERISRNPALVASGISLTVEATVTAVSSPGDGLRFWELLAAAKQRDSAQRSTYEGRSIH